MVTITRKLEIPEDRTVVIKLPDTVPPGPHEVVVIVGEETTEGISSDSNAEVLMCFAGTIRDRWTGIPTSYQGRVGMNFLLDTNTIIYLINNRLAGVERDVR